LLGLQAGSRNVIEGLEEALQGLQATQGEEVVP
jgi:FKBP-type peptidyl-prolyl cis-trans isomerase 2